MRSVLSPNVHFFPSPASISVKAVRVLALLAVLLSMLAVPQAKAQDLFGSARVVKSHLVWSTPQGRAGGQAVLAVVINVDEHYHINPDRPQIPESLGYLEALAITPSEVPPEVLIGAPQFPKATTVPFEGLDEPVPAYQGQTVVYLPLAIDPQYQGSEIKFKVSVYYQSCNDSTCLMPSTTILQASLPVVAADAVIADLPEAEAELFKNFDASVFANLAGSMANSKLVAFNILSWNWSFNAASGFGLIMILLMAILGGLALNFTPCVLPVIPIKILSLKQAAGSHRRQLLLGASMSLGVMAFWVGLGLAIVIAAQVAETARRAAAGDVSQTGMQFTSTNQLFQYPLFTIGVGIIIGVMAVGMCGLFAVRLPQWVYRINPGHNSLHGSFGFGVMTAVLSTPCTAPLMGSAAAWAVGQNVGITMSVFLAIGGGMALPYMLLAANPAWIDRMPRTGPASELIKQVMGLLLLAAAVFFVGTGISGMMVQPPAPPGRMYWWFVAAVVAVTGVWLIWQILKIAKSKITKMVFVPVGILLILMAIAGGLSFTDKGPIDWTYYTPQALTDAKASGNVVVVEFTAEWCLNCKLLEQSVLSSKDVATALNSKNVAAIKVDLTGNGAAAGNALLKEMDRVAIPLLVVMKPTGEVVFKSDNYTVGDVLDAVRRASEK